MSHNKILYWLTSWAVIYWKSAEFSLIPWIITNKYYHSTRRNIRLIWITKIFSRFKIFSLNKNFVQPTKLSFVKSSFDRTKVFFYSTRILLIQPKIFISTYFCYPNKLFFQCSKNCQIITKWNTIKIKL